MLSRSIRFIVVTLVVLVCSQAANHKATNASIIPIAQPLHIEMTATGPVIRDLFGRFPYVVTSSGCAVVPIHNLSASFMKTSKTVLNPANGIVSLGNPPTGCQTPHCPFNTMVDYIEGCQCPSRGQADTYCTYNQSCTNYKCVNASVGSCIRCRWVADSCAGCITTGSCD